MLSYPNVSSHFPVDENVERADEDIERDDENIEKAEEDTERAGKNIEKPENNTEREAINITRAATNIPECEGNTTNNGEILTSIARGITREEEGVGRGKSDISRV